jgi:hypothetical protein
MADTANRPKAVSTSAASSGQKQSQLFFFENKQQKTFVRLGFGFSGEAQPGVAKVFGCFSSEKKTPS